LGIFLRLGLDQGMQQRNLVITICTGVVRKQTDIWSKWTRLGRTLQVSEFDTSREHLRALAYIDVELVA
jgi:hypothetical protein